MIIGQISWGWSQVWRCGLRRGENSNTVSDIRLAILGGPGEIIIPLETWVLSSSSSVLIRSRMFGEPVHGVSEEPGLVVTLELVMSSLWSLVSCIVYQKF